MFHLYNFMLLQGCSKPLTDKHLFLLSGAAVASASSQLTYHPHWLVVRPPTFFDIHFTQPFFLEKTEHFCISKLKLHIFLPQNSDAGSFSTPSSSSQLRPCLWDQPVVSSTERHHPHETASNQSEPKFNKKNKETKRSSLQKRSKNATNIYDFFPFSKHRFNFPPFSLLPPWLHFSVVLSPWIMQILTVYMLKWGKKWDVKVYKFIHHHCVFE